MCNCYINIKNNVKINGAEEENLTNCEKDLILFEKLSERTKNYLLSAKTLNFFDSDATEQIYRSYTENERKGRSI